MSTTNSTVDRVALVHLPPQVDELPVMVIERRDGWRSLDLAELWQHRELLYFLTWRDVKVRYKQTVLGAAWAILQPLAIMTVFTLFLGRLAAKSSGAVPYPLFVLGGLLPWMFFASAISSAAPSLVGSQNLVTKVYFPRLLIPMAAVVAGSVDFAIASALLLLMMIYYAVMPGWALLWVPVVSVVLALAAVGVGALLAALTVAYRDFRYVVPFLVQLWMFATPSIYMDTQALLSSSWHAVLPLNPAYGLVISFRAATLGGDLDFYGLGLSSAVSLGLLFAGCFYFRRVEREFADII